MSECVYSPTLKPPLPSHNPAHSPPWKKRRGKLQKVFGLRTSDLFLFLIHHFPLNLRVIDFGSLFNFSPVDGFVVFFHGKFCIKNA